MFKLLKHWLIGKPKDIEDPHLFHKVSLIAFFAWIGLGSDGLSSSAYGPAETFKALGEHRELAVFLALATALTVGIISWAYSNVIEHFPNGGGGYVVATKLLGAPAGLVSGCALLIDYVLTITVSISSGADALFAFLPETAVHWKLPCEYAAIIILIIMNLRGIKESITVLVPIFVLFLVTHAVMLVAILFNFYDRVPQVAHDVTHGLHDKFTSMGFIALFLIFVKAYSQGAGTFTGIEAVSNGLAIMRDPKVKTGKRTMLYMALSLAITAGGILLCFLIANVHPPLNPADPANPYGDKPLNAVLLENLAQASPFFGHWFVVLTLVAEAALLVIAAQTGFIDGPRVMANMALDSWLPHRFSSLSERLTTHYGIFLIGAAALAALWYTGGNVDTLVTMYSINVFITFSLTLLGMSLYYIRSRIKGWKTNLPIQLTGLLMCGSILCMVVYEKFWEGGWITLAITAALVGVCVIMKRYYASVNEKLGLISIQVEDKDVPHDPLLSNLDFTKPIAIMLVGRYGGVGIHSFLEMRRLFPGFFTQVMFISVGVIDSGNFKGDDEIEKLRVETKASLDKYVKLAKRLGMAAHGLMEIGNEPVSPAVELCTEVALRYKKAMFFAGKLVFQRETWYQRLLHNETAMAIQNRLQWLGYPMVIMPVRIWGEGKRKTSILPRTPEKPTQKAETPPAPTESEATGVATSDVSELKP